MSHATRSEYRCDGACAATDAIAALFVLDPLGGLAPVRVRRNGALLIFSNRAVVGHQVVDAHFRPSIAVRGDG